MEGEEAFFSREFLDVAAGFGAEFFYRFALMADEDGLLALALDIDDARDVVDTVALLVARNGHFAAVGYLFLVVEEYLFADDLADKEAHRLACELAVRIVGRMLGEHSKYGVKDARQVESFGGGAGNDHRAGYQLLPVVDFLLHEFLVRKVYLVDYKQYRHLRLDYLLLKGLVFQRLAELGHDKEEVGVLEGCADEAHHLLVELVGRIDDTWGIGVDDLEVIACNDAHYSLAGCLRFGGDDAEFLAHKGIHQGRLPDIRVADDVDKTTFHF